MSTLSSFQQKLEELGREDGWEAYPFRDTSGNDSVVLLDAHSHNNLNSKATEAFMKTSSPIWGLIASVSGNAWAGIDGEGGPALKERLLNEVKSEDGHEDLVLSLNA